MLEIIFDQGTPAQYIWTCDCGPFPDDDPLFNDCGCPLPDSSLKPAGLYSDRK